ncbi:ABC transporter substrate-binding protein [Lacticaseibacillus yichunensis]|uniref:ABC transporter substrate-binding protein n=1 Tax=Lacticaseibacillus yichunensis TaxID=2486015 RepID=A0ABW4CQQ0_9LACO|nr:ABC transporter substrate-binding protein [Lacticaseibacillus yichunensis]
MHYSKRVLMIAAASASAILLAACGSNGSSSSNGGSSSKTVVTMIQPGSGIQNETKLMAAANKELQKKYPNIELKIKQIDWGDYGQKFNVMVTSGESYDLAFSQDYAANASKGVFQDLTSLIKDNAKEAYDAIDPAYWQGVKVDGKIYGFPTNANVFSQQAFVFNPTFTKKYGIDVSKVDSYQSLEPVLKEFHEKNPNVVAFPLVKGARISLKAMSYPLGNNFPFAIDASGKSTKVVNQYDTKEMMDDMKTLHKYYQAGYLPKDAATSSTTYNAADDTWFVQNQTVGPFDYGNNALKTAANGKDIIVNKFTDAYKQTSDAQMAVYVMSKTSNHKKEAMQVMNAINTDKKLENILVWGVEGQQWKFTNKANGQIETLKGYDATKALGAWLTGNNRLLYTKSNITPDDIATRDSSIKSAKDSATLGFNPTTDDVKTELTNVSNVMSKYADILNTGTADPTTTVKQMDKELKAAGWDKVQKSLQKQYDAFLASK